MKTRAAAAVTILALSLAGVAQAQTRTAAMPGPVTSQAAARPVAVAPRAVHQPARHPVHHPAVVHRHFFGRNPFFCGRHSFCFGSGLLVASPVAADPSPQATIYPVPVYVPNPASYAQPQGGADYWAYCQDPQGYYPYVAQCPSGWLPVTPTSMPPPRMTADVKQSSATGMSIEELREAIRNSRAN